MGCQRRMKPVYRVVSKSSMWLATASTIAAVVVAAANQLWSSEDAWAKAVLSCSILYAGYAAASVMAAVCDRKPKEPRSYRSLCKAIHKLIFRLSSNLFIGASIGVSYGFTKIPHGLRNGRTDAVALGLLTAANIAGPVYFFCERKKKRRGRQVRYGCLSLLTRKSFWIATAVSITSLILGECNQLWSKEQSWQRLALSFGIVYVGMAADALFTEKSEGALSSPKVYRSICRGVHKAIFSWSTSVFLVGSIAGTYGLARVPHGIKGGLASEIIISMVSSGILALACYFALEKRYPHGLLACPRVSARAEIPDDAIVIGGPGSEAPFLGDYDAHQPQTWA